MTDQGQPVPTVRFEQVTKVYEQRQSLFGRRGADVKALNGVSFQVFPGEIFSLVGESGSGKTTCGRILVRLEEPTTGGVFFDGHEIRNLRGRAVRSFRRQMQMIFQDPYQSLNPQLTIFQTVVEPLVVQRLDDHLSREEKVRRVLEEVGLKPAVDFLFRYPHQLSGGQRQRVAVARALILDPRFIVADEPVSMLDASIQAQLLNMLLDLRERRSLTLLFITHDLATARYVSDRIAVVYNGKIMEKGPVEQIIQHPLHPYTRTLIQAVPSLKRRKEDLPSAACPVDMYFKPPEHGCPFAQRCPQCSSECLKEEMPLQEVQKDHHVACILHYG
jgi:peptide/nickel transport system ATP-binding protein